MVTIIKTEFMKLKRYFIVWIGVSLMLQWPMTEWYGTTNFFLNR